VFATTKTKNMEKMLLEQLCKRHSTLAVGCSHLSNVESWHRPS